MIIRWQPPAAHRCSASPTSTRAAEAGASTSAGDGVRPRAGPGGLSGAEPVVVVVVVVQSLVVTLLGLGSVGEVGGVLQWSVAGLACSASLSSVAYLLQSTSHHTHRTLQYT